MAYTSAKFFWSEMRRLVDNSFKVWKRVKNILWEERTSADWSFCAKTEKSSGLHMSLGCYILDEGTFKIWHWGTFFKNKKVNEIWNLTFKNLHMPKLNKSLHMPKLNKREIVRMKSFQVLVQTDQTISKSISATYNLVLTVYDNFINLTTQML